MDKLVNLNVGGCLYTTTRSTLTRYPDSMLAAMFRGELGAFVHDSSGAYVIDGDGPIFRHVLNFLRRGKLILPEDFKEWELLASESDFYQIPDLVAAVSSRKEVEDNPKMEFVEFTEQSSRCKYMGSWETLNELPREFLIVFEADPSLVDSEAQRLRSLEDMRWSLEKYGEISGYYGSCSILLSSSSRLSSIRPEINRPNWMEVFERTSELGFQLLSTTGMSGTETWLFGRKISNHYDKKHTGSAGLLGN